MRSEIKEKNVITTRSMLQTKQYRLVDMLYTLNVFNFSAFALLLSKFANDFPELSVSDKNDWYCRCFLLTFLERYWNCIRAVRTK